MINVKSYSATVRVIPLFYFLIISYLVIYVTLSGLDTAFNIVSGWHEEFPEEKSFVIPDCLVAKVKKGEMGRKSGKGFYNWDGDKILGPV